MQETPSPSPPGTEDEESAPQVTPSINMLSPHDVRQRLEHIARSTGLPMKLISDDPDTDTVSRHGWHRALSVAILEILPDRPTINQLSQIFSFLSRFGATLTVTGARGAIVAKTSSRAYARALEEKGWNLGLDKARSELLQLARELVAQNRGEIVRILSGVDTQAPRAVAEFPPEIERELSKIALEHSVTINRIKGRLDRSSLLSGWPRALFVSILNRRPNMKFTRSNISAIIKEISHYGVVLDLESTMMYISKKGDIRGVIADLMDEREWPVDIKDARQKLLEFAKETAEKLDIPNILPDK